MNSKSFTRSFIYLIIAAFSFCIISFRLSNEPTLEFKIMVINLKTLDSVYKSGVTNIVFQHSNGKGADAGRRRKYHLIAFAKESDGSYARIPEETFFVNRTMNPMFTPITIKGDGVTSNFGNLTLQKDSLPQPPDTSYHFLILIPDVYNLDDDSRPLDREYVYYKMYFAKGQNDLPTSTEAFLVIPIANSLNPSPPRKAE